MPCRKSANSSLCFSYILAALLQTSIDCLTSTALSCVCSVQLHKNRCQDCTWMCRLYGEVTFILVYQEVCENWSLLGSGAVFLGTTCSVTQCHISENLNPQQHYQDDRKSWKKFVICNWKLVMYGIKFAFVYCFSALCLQFLRVHEDMNILRRFPYIRADMFLCLLQLDSLRLDSGKSQLTEHINHLEEQLRKHRLHVEQFQSNSTAVLQMKAQVRHLCGKEHIHTYTSIYTDTLVYMHTCLHLFPVLSTNAVCWLKFLGFKTPLWVW